MNKAFYITIVLVLLTACSASNQPINKQTNLPECTLTDCNCSDFSTQEEAQKVFSRFPNLHPITGKYGENWKSTAGI